MNKLSRAGMHKGRSIQTFLTISTGVALVTIIGSGLVLAQQRGWWDKLGDLGIQIPFLPGGQHRKPADSKSEVLPLVLLSPQERAETLESMAMSDRTSFENSRARYLLANDQLAVMEGGQALRLLSGLESDYPILAPYILLKRARAYELTNELDRSKETLEELVEKYPESPAVADAYYALSQFEDADREQYVEKAIAEHPHHPSTHALVQEALENRLAQPKLIFFAINHNPNGAGVEAALDYLVRNYAEQIQPEDWEAIADAYWEQNEYSDASIAYSKAPETAKNLYRAGRSREINGNIPEALLNYQKVAGEFPNSDEAPQALLHLASNSPPEEAIQYLQSVIDNFPKEAPDALMTKSQLLEEKFRSREGATEAKQTLLKTYANSEAASKYRWQKAREAAAKREYAQAWKWAYPIPTNTPDSNLAPEAAFWVGKWASRLDLPEEAEAAYKYVLSHHPESYFAWRSAVMLGWDVGDFTTVRAMSPKVDPPDYRSEPPAGSEQFKELYQLGQDEDAVRLWNAEVYNPNTYGNAGDTDEPRLTVAEQFTTGLLRQAQGNFLGGITAIWSLKVREDAESQEAWQALREKDIYWQALFPFPYEKLILEGAEANDINPLLVVSLIRQESRFNPEIKSSAGALGLMQVMPDTAEWIVEQEDLGLGEDYSLLDPKDNITLGSWFLNFTHQQYNDNSMLAIASYNAGPGNVSNWTQRFPLDDPDEFIEKIPFGETKNYVETVFSNYWNYLRLYNPEVPQMFEALQQESVEMDDEALQELEESPASPSPDTPQEESASPQEAATPEE